MRKPTRQPRKQPTPRRSKSAVLQSLREEAASESSDDDYLPEPNPAIKAAVSLHTTSTPAPRRGTRARQAPSRFGDPLRHAVQTVHASPSQSPVVPKQMVEKVECGVQTEDPKFNTPVGHANPYTEMVSQIQACRKKTANANYQRLKQSIPSVAAERTEEEVEATIQEHENYLNKLPKMKISQVLETIQKRDTAIREPVVRNIS